MMIKCKGTNGQKLFFKEEILSVEYYFYTLVRVKNHCFAFESAVTGRRLLEKQAMNYLNIIVLQSHRVEKTCKHRKHACGTHWIFPGTLSFKA